MAHERRGFLDQLRWLTTMSLRLQKAAREGGVGEKEVYCPWRFP